MARPKKTTSGSSNQTSSPSNKNPKKVEVKKPEEYYSAIAINKTKRAGFLMSFSLLFTMMTLTIMAKTLADGNWSQIILPIVLIGFPMILYPPVERWVYKPWQVRAQKYERHYKGR